MRCNEWQLLLVLRRPPITITLDGLLQSKNSDSSRLDHCDSPGHYRVSAAGRFSPHETPRQSARSRQSGTFLAYTVLAFLPTIHERRGYIIAAAIGAVALGVGLEYAQLYSGWRDFEVRDMVADAAGVLTGVAAGIPLRSAEIVRPFLSPLRADET